MARRLGGSLLQRTQAAVAEEGGLLVPSRLMRSRELSSKASGQHARSHSTCQIQQKEEEQLYDVLNKAIEKHFSAQATQRTPFDPMRFKKYTERARGVLDLACKATFFVYGSAFLFGITGVDRMLGFPRKVNEDKNVGLDRGSQ